MKTDPPPPPGGVIIRCAIVGRGWLGGTDDLPKLASKKGNHIEPILYVAAEFQEIPLIIIIIIIIIGGAIRDWFRAVKHTA